MFNRIILHLTLTNDNHSVSVSLMRFEWKVDYILIFLISLRINVMNQPDRIDILVKDYLNMNTEYALLITGEWGSGKTFYFNNILKDNIQKVKVGSGKKSFKILYLSLFGLNSIEEIQQLMFLELFPLFKTKTAKIGGAALKIIMTGVTNLVSIGDLKLDELKDQITSGKNKLSDYVICFDDLERKGKDLETGALIGFINSLIENNGKVVLIGYQEKMTIDDFAEVREKVIGNIIEFSPDNNRIYDEIIKFYSTSNQEFYNHLQEKKDFIIVLMKLSASKNYRILKFFFEHYRTIFETLISIKDEFPQDMRDEILESVLMFCFTVSVEYRLGHITIADKGSFKGLNVFLQSLNSTLNNQKSENQNNWNRFINNKYFKNKPYKPFYSIFDFLTGANSLNKEQLKTEIEKEFNIKSKVRLPQYKLLNYFFFQEFLTSEESIFEENKQQLLGYTRKGSFDLLYDYLIILDLVISFPEIFDLKPEIFEKELEEVVKSQGIYSETNEFDRINKPDLVIKQFKNFCSEYLRETQTINQQEIIQSLFDLFRESKSEFYEKISTNNSGIYPLFTPKVLPSFLESFDNMNNKELSDFFDFLYERYSRIGIVSERDFLKQFSETLENIITKEDKKVRRWHLVHLKSFIDKKLQQEIQR